MTALQHLAFPRFTGWKHLRPFHTKVVRAPGMNHGKTADAQTVKGQNMATQKNPTKAKPQVKVKDLKPKKNPKGGRDPQSGLPTGQ